MNGFEKHGIKHLSASSLNMYAECPAAWSARYLFGRNFKFGVAAQVGVRTEDVVTNTLLGVPYEDALKREQDRFRKDNLLNTNEKEVARVEHIAAMSALALEELKPYGEPEFIKTIQGVKQQKIELKCNGKGWKMPIIGYLDYVFPQHNTIIDLKTTMRMPSVMSHSHKRQAAIYKKARGGNSAVKFLYVTPKKVGWHEIDDIEMNEQLAVIKKIATRQEAMLRNLSQDQIKEFIPVNSGSFYWAGDESIRQELYGV